jgi:hypothetical protein
LAIASNRAARATRQNPETTTGAEMSKALRLAWIIVVLPGAAATAILVVQGGFGEDTEDSIFLSS